MLGRALAVLGILAGFALVILSAPRLYPYFEPARLIYGVHGIDVSHHQGPIDWPAVVGGGVAFVYMKATEGGDFVDPRFAENWAGAADAGVKRGAYHFFTQCRSGAAQAANFIRVVPRDASALRHALDAEHMGPCREGPAVDDVVAEIETFLDQVQAHYGLRPLVYTTREFHRTYLRNALDRDGFWIRSLVRPPSFRTQHWVVWQYHNWGRRPGIEGPVDLNVLRCPLWSDDVQGENGWTVPLHCAPPGVF
ncbi:MAG: GH25 family lysozyme [Myxococcota bacterium]